MASRSIKVRQVFAELRHALGAEIPAGELLRLAAALVDATYPREPKDEHRNVADRPAFDQVPLDRAFADGGWHIMETEPRWASEAYWDDDPRFAVANANTVKVELAA